LVVSHKAIAQIVSQTSTVSGASLPETVLRNETLPPLTGQVFCPRGCGTRIFWALSADLAEYKEAFLVYLNQQLSWTPCPDHHKIQPQCQYEDDLVDMCLPSPAAVLGPGPRYVNCYE
jgi:hypothetical protein